MTPSIQILYEDNHLLGVLKPAGLLAQGDRTGDATALEMARRYIQETHRRPGNVFVGLVHRLDRPVSGVMIFARTSKAASRLARTFHDRRVEKCYLAVVMGTVHDDEGELTGFVERAHTRSRLADPASARARAASLTFRVLARADGPPSAPQARRRAPTGRSLLEVRPRTGRHHQIRLQLAAAGHPIVGDLKYGAPEPLPGKAIALHAVRLRFPHPVRDDTVEIAAPPSPSTPWTLFTPAIARYLASPSPHATS
jgi:23S rRNA pseudouridine1911/1915/1917 synthase